MELKMPKKIVNGQEIDLTNDENKQRIAEGKKQIAEYEKIKYLNNRKHEYPSAVEQLDYIFHHGIDKWKKDIIEPVKIKFPKP